MVYLPYFETSGVLYLVLNCSKPHTRKLQNCISTLKKYDMYNHVVRKMKAKIQLKPHWILSQALWPFVTQAFVSNTK